jgi:hypothetical protein
MLLDSGEYFGIVVGSGIRRRRITDGTSPDNEYSKSVKKFASSHRAA